VKYRVYFFYPTLWIISIKVRKLHLRIKQDKISYPLITIAPSIEIPSITILKLPQNLNHQLLDVAVSFAAVVQSYAFAAR